MPSPSPSAREFFLALIALHATGEDQRVGTTVLPARKVWPTSMSAMQALALDMARAERDASRGVAA